MFDGASSLVQEPRSLVISPDALTCDRQGRQTVTCPGIAPRTGAVEQGGRHRVALGHAAPLVKRPPEISARRSEPRVTGCGQLLDGPLLHLHRSTRRERCDGLLGAPRDGLRLSAHLARFESVHLDAAEERCTGEQAGERKLSAGPT
jgi:hypothetical protein